MSRLPDRNADLLRYVRRRRAFKILLFAAWFAFLTLALLYFNRTHRYSVQSPIAGWRLWVWIGFSLLSGFVLFGMFRTFFDRSFEGEILRSSLSHSYSTSQDANAPAASYNYRLDTVLRVRTPDGKIRKLRFEQKPGFFFYYYEGNYIRYFSGLPYPIADPKRMQAAEVQKWSADEDTTGDENPLPKRNAHKNAYLCAACGHFYPTPTRCENCGHSLIDPKDIFDE